MIGGKNHKQSGIQESNIVEERLSRVVNIHLGHRLSDILSKTLWEQYSIWNLT